MVTNIILGTNDLVKAEQFYDALLFMFDAKQTIKNDRSILWKSENNSVGIAVCLPYDELPASSGNGCMVGLKAESVEHLKNVYQTALKLGGSCEGEPGERSPGVYAAYFRDPDHNKFGIFYIQEQQEE